MINVITPPQAINNTEQNTVFLAGTIDMGQSEDWQSYAVNYFHNNCPTKSLTIFNPRRKDWDSSWKQSIDNPEFYRQVNWELNAMDRADYILFYFAANSKSPITLMELGLHANESYKCTVVCPKGYWRRGNIEVVCEKYGLPLYESLESGLEKISEKLY